MRNIQQNENHQSSNATNDAVNGLETATKLDENIPGIYFSYGLLQNKSLQK